MNLGDRTETEALGAPSDAEAKIWRYMSFAKFVAMLEAGALYFSRLDCFTDRFEGTLSRVSVGADDELSVDVNAQMTYREVREMVRKLRKELFVNCWCLSDEESEGMWRLYGGSPGGSSHPIDVFAIEEVRGKTGPLDRDCAICGLRSRKGVVPLDIPPSSV